MTKKVYDTAKFSERMGEIWSLGYLKCVMLEAIGNIAVAVKDKDADRLMEIQCDLMWCYEIFGTIEEREVEQ